MLLPSAVWAELCELVETHSWGEPWRPRRRAHGQNAAFTLKSWKNPCRQMPLAHFQEYRDHDKKPAI